MLSIDFEIPVVRFITLILQLNQSRALDRVEWFLATAHMHGHALLAKSTTATRYKLVAIDRDGRQAPLVRDAAFYAALLTIQLGRGLVLCE